MQCRQRVFVSPQRYFDDRVRRGSFRGKLCTYRTTNARARADNQTYFFHVSVLRCLVADLKAAVLDE